MKALLITALVLVAGVAHSETEKEICYGAYGPGTYISDNYGTSDLKNCLARIAEKERLAKLPGVSIGMSANDVVTKSSWGRPNSVNRTTTAYGTFEQWVYGGRNYLYFDNGRLTAIQN